MECPFGLEARLRLWEGRTRTFSASEGAIATGSAERPPAGRCDRLLTSCLETLSDGGQGRALFALGAENGIPPFGQLQSPSAMLQSPSTPASWLTAAGRHDEEPVRGR